MTNSLNIRSVENRNHKQFSEALHPVSSAINKQERRAQTQPAVMANQITLVRKYASSVEGIIRIILIVCQRLVRNFTYSRPRTVF